MPNHHPSQVSRVQRRLDHSIDVEAIIEHLTWVSKHQGDGYLALRFLRETQEGERKLIESHFVENSPKTWERELRDILKKVPLAKRHCFYSVHAFNRESATVKALVSGRLAHVDADNVQLPPRGPTPSRIVQTSKSNYQFLYSLDRELNASDLQKISRYLTRETGGDAGGHSPAKLLRLPGTFNIKSDYPQPFFVRIL